MAHGFTGSETQIYISGLTGVHLCQIHIVHRGLGHQLQAEQGRGQVKVGLSSILQAFEKLIIGSQPPGLQEAAQASSML